VRFLHKQNGSFLVGDRRRSKAATGRELDGRTYDDMPDATWPGVVLSARLRREFAAWLVPEANGQLGLPPDRLELLFGAAMLEIL
jgi:hypothetical protein